MEGIAHNCIPIVFDPTTDSNYLPDVESLGVGGKSKTVSEFFCKIGLIQKGKEDYLRTLHSYQKNYFKAIYTDAILKQSEVVNKIVPMKNRLYIPNKLNIGCGRNIMKGWLNADLYNISPDVFQMDASRTFPFAADEFDYIFSEHMFEHLNLCGQQNMLKECYRVLKPGGVLRIAIPDFDFLIDLVNNPDSEINSKYLDWSYKRFVSKNVNFEVTRSNYPIYVVNNFMHDWGHQFIHSKHSLIEIGKSCGFSNAEVCNSGSSTYPDLCSCEKHQNEIPAWANNLETFVVEFFKRRNNR